MEVGEGSKAGVIPPKLMLPYSIPLPLKIVPGGDNGPSGIRSSVWEIFEKSV